MASREDDVNAATSTLEHVSSIPSVRVLESFRPNAMTNPYLLLLHEALRERIEVETFSWRTALLGRYDVLHVHWPEVLIRGSNRPKTMVRSIAFVAMLVVLRCRRRALVRTLHNLEPHEPPGFLAGWILRLGDRCTTSWIGLTSTTRPPRGHASTVIPLGHYRDWYPAVDSVSPMPGRLLFFGRIRPYKGVEELIAAAADVDDPDFSLRIVGKVDDPALFDAVASASASASPISSRLEFVDDDELAREVATAQLVVLPFREMVNSSSVLMALSLSRPVLVPASPSMVELRDEVGPEWIRMYDGELSAATITEALDTTHTLPSEPPDLSRRGWGTLADAHVEVFVRAAAASRGS